jgi:signal transduction histidine kinase
MIEANEEFLREVWINLLDNAVKFSNEGGEVSVDVKESDGVISVSVSNTGSSIGEEEKKKIFNKFYQSDESHSSVGNGIGLAIVKRVVELHRGDIIVESESDKVRFVVRLPAVI